MRRLTRDEFHSLRSLHSRSSREEQNLLIVPGLKCCQEFLASGGRAHWIIAREDRRQELDAWLEQAPGQTRGAELRMARDTELAKLAEQRQPEGLIIVGPRPQGGDRLPPDFLLDGLSDLGNLGAIIRSALWFGLRSLWLLAPAADPWSPRGIRASMGAVFRLPCCHTTDEEGLRAELAQRPRRLLLLEAAGTASLATHRFRDHDLPVLGGESHGLRLQPEGEHLRMSIPGAGGMDSLNAGHAFAICAWQRWQSRPESA